MKIRLDVLATTALTIDFYQDPIDPPTCQLHRNPTYNVIRGDPGAKDAL